VSILSGVRNAGDSVLSNKLYNKMKSLFPHQREQLISGSILLCNTYLSVNEYGQAEDIRSNRLKTLGSNVQVGVAWTAANGEIVVKFVLFNVDITIKTRNFLDIQSWRSFTSSIIRNLC